MMLSFLATDGSLPFWLAICIGKSFSFNYSVFLTRVAGRWRGCRRANSILAEGMPIETGRAGMPN